jgi:hypothetical protein
MFLDLGAPYILRSASLLQSFHNLDGKNQHKVLRHWIHLQFRAIYTKARSAATCLGIRSYYVLPSLPLASVVLFARSNEDGCDGCGTVLYLSFEHVFAFMFSSTTTIMLARHGCPAQHHVILCSIGRRRPQL